MCLEVPVSTGTFLFNFIGMRILTLLLLYCSFANAQDCSTLIKCYDKKCYQQDTVRGFGGGYKTSIPKIWLTSSDTNYYLNIVFTDTISGENIKLKEPRTITFTFYDTGKIVDVNRAYFDESFYCDYSGCIVHKIPLSKYGTTAKLSTYFSESKLAYLELHELDRRQAFRDGDMVSDGVFEMVADSRLSEAEWQKLKLAMSCILNTVK